MPDAKDVASAVLRIQGPMTPMQLQKLVYYCQAWHLARRGRPMFTQRVEAWQQGPVVPELWRVNKYAPVISDVPGGHEDHLDESEVETVGWVLQRYGHFTALELSRMTHMEAPWVVTREGLPPDAYSDRPISHELMGSFYARQIEGPEAAVTDAVANAALEGVDLDASWQEELRKVATGALDADDLIRREIKRLGYG